MKMNNYAAAAFALAGLCIASCNKEQIVEGPVEASPEKVELRIVAGNPDSKTTFHDPAAEDYSVIWQNDDKVGLFIADKTANAEAGLTRTESGKAYFLSKVSGYAEEDMLYAYYPYAAPAEGETVTATAVKLSIPAEQTQKDGFNGSYNPMVAVPVALPAPGTAIEEPLKFRHLGAMVELKINGDATKHAGEKITSVSFAAKDGGKVAGEFSFDLTKVTKTEALAEYSGSSETITVTLETPVEVSADGASVFMTVIPGSYTGAFTITTTSAAAEGEGAAAGDGAAKEETHTYNFTAQNNKYGRATVTRYALDLKNATAISDEIKTVADWEIFAKTVKNVDYTGVTITLGNDLEATNLSIATGTFNGKFAGNGHTITQSANTRPLFETLGENAEVSNLTLAGAFASFEKPYEYGNAALAKVNLGTVSNVTVNCPVNATVNEAMLIGALVAQNGGTLQSCKNLGDIVLKIHNPNTDKHIANLGGGLAAFGNTMGAVVEASGIYGKHGAALKAGKFIGCVNEGDISVTASAEGEKKIVGVSVYGGICGSVQVDGVVFDGCSNTGNISRVSNKEASAGASTSIGGILGCCNAANYNNNGDQEYVNPGSDGAGIAVTVKNCSNEGQMFSSCRHNGFVGKGHSGARHDNVGGIVGAVIGGDAEAKQSSISGCHNTGIVSGGWSGNVNTTVLGGIAGLAKNVKIEDCESAGTLKNDASHCVGAVGGFAAYVIKNVSVVGGSCTASFDMKKLSNNFFWGLAFGNVKSEPTKDGVVTEPNNSSVAGVTFGPNSVNIDGTAVTLSKDKNIYSEASGATPTIGEDIVWSNN